MITLNPLSHASNSRISIGIIGPKHLCDDLKPVLKTFPSFQPSFQEITASSEIIPALKNLISYSDVLLFLEWYQYIHAKQHIQFHLPVHVVSPTGTGLYRTVLLATKTNIPHTISVDTVNEAYIRQVLDELHVSIPEQFFYSDKYSGVQDIVDWHVKYNKIAVTGMTEVAELLQQQRITTYLIKPTRNDYIVTLERALLSTNTRQNNETHLVFIFISIHISDGEIDHTIHHVLKDFAQQLDSYIQSVDSNNFLLITTRGTFERETRGYKYIPFLHQENVHIHIGVGFGISAVDAGNNAHLALQQAIDNGHNVCYIVREDLSVLGPVEVSAENNYEQYYLSITDQAFLDKAEQAGMSASYMAKLMAKVSRHKKIDYTAAELAQTLHLTVRSANRILLKWMDADLVRIVGEEKLSDKGRPRRIYQLTFIDDELLS